MDANLNDIYKGNTLEDVIFTMTNQADGTAYDLTGATITSTWRRGTKDGQLVKSLSIGSGITVTDASGGVFQFDEFVITWSPDIYYYNVTITDTNGVILTYFIGTMRVIENL